MSRREATAPVEGDRLWTTTRPIGDSDPERVERTEAQSPDAPADGLSSVHVAREVHRRVAERQTVGVLRVYLDQNKWVDLLHAAAGDDLGLEFVEVHDALVEAILGGAVLVPLSSVHLVETWRIRRDNRRFGLAAVMMKFSRRHTIAPIGELLPAEIELALHRMCGRPVVPREPRAFGTGLAFALGYTGAAVDAPMDVPEVEAAMVEFWAVASGDRSAELAAASADRYSADRSFQAAEEQLRQQLHDEGYKKHGEDRTFVTLATQTAERELVAAYIGNDVPLATLTALGPAGSS